MLTSYEVDKTMFYIWMRKRNRLVRAVDSRTFKIYINVECYNNDKYSYIVAVYQPS